MRITLLTIAYLLTLFLCSRAYADDFQRYSGHSYSNRSYVYVYDGRSGSRTYGPGSGFTSDSSDTNSCFPHGCGGISGPFKNPNPDARKPENLTACMYDASGTLLYERENKVCPYKYIDQNQLRVERRKQEWLRAQAAR